MVRQIENVEKQSYSDANHLLRVPEKQEPWAKSSPQSLPIWMDKGISGGIEILWTVMEVS